MGLFDRFRSAGPAPVGSSENKPDTSEQDALRLVDEGNAIEDEGRIEAAMQRYEAALLLVPNLARAHLNRGNILSIMGNVEGALEAYSIAIQCNPDYAGAYYNLGNASARLGRQEAALDAYHKAIKLQPGYADADMALGGVLEDLGRDDDAMAHYQAALTQNPQHTGAAHNLERLLIKAGQRMFHAERHAELENWARLVLEQNRDSGFAWKILGASLQMQGKDGLSALQNAIGLLPGDAEAHSNLGNALKDLGRLGDAVASYRCALKISPDCAEVHSNLGVALQEMGQLGDAVASCRRALEIKPDDAEAHNNLGNALKGLGQLEDAAASYRCALAIKSGYAEAYSNLGSVLLELGQPNDAVESCRRALEIKPGYAKAYGNLGSALLELGQLNDAEASYRRALEISPDSAEAHGNLGAALIELQRHGDAVASYRRALEIKPDLAWVHSNLIFIYNLLVSHPPEEMLAEALTYGERVALQAHLYTSWLNVPEPDRCLRVGLVSGDFLHHPVGFFVESVLAALKSQASGRLKLLAYSSHSRFDAVSERIKICCDGWCSVVGLSNENLARRISEDSIDILIDLSGHTAHNRLPLFAWKPAPVQVSWLGYFATTGVTAMDYLIADPWTLPETEEAYFIEKIWRLPETRLCFTPPGVNVDVAPLPALKRGYVTFGCFNNLAKMNDAVVVLWARVLKAVPGSRLLLKAKQLQVASVRQSVIERFSAQGVGADRLMMEGSDAREKYLAAYHRVDIALDPFPYTGGTTSVEGLWMGVPVLTLAGKSFLSRQGVGLLMNSGLPEWIAADADDYVARAVSHASDLQRLAALRNGLRQQVTASPIFDAPRFARHLEDALRGMWRIWCDQQQ